MVTARETFALGDRVRFTDAYLTDTCGSYKIGPHRSAIRRAARFTVVGYSHRRPTVVRVLRDGISSPTSYAMDSLTRVEEPRS